MSEQQPEWSYDSSDKYYLLKDNCVVAEMSDWREAAALAGELNRLRSVETAARRALEIWRQKPARQYEQGGAVRTCWHNDVFAALAAALEEGQPIELVGGGGIVELGEEA